MKDYEASAAVFYVGGWRAEDRIDLTTVYGLTDEEAEQLCKILLKMETAESITNG